MLSVLDCGPWFFTNLKWICSPHYGATIQTRRLCIYHLDRSGVDEYIRHVDGDKQRYTNLIVADGDNKASFSPDYMK